MKEKTKSNNREGIFKMKKQKIIVPIIAIITISNLGGFALTGGSVSADTIKSSQHLTVEKQKDFKNFDQYISVSNNQFVFRAPNDKIISKKEQIDIDKVLARSNKFVIDNHMIINPTTKVATQVNNLNQSNSYGTTGIFEVHWNYLKIGLDQGAVKDVVTGGTAGASAAVAFLVGGPWAAAGAAIVSTILANHYEPTSGYWFDYNFWTFQVTDAGQQ